MFTKLTEANNNNHTLRLHNFTGKIPPKQALMVSTGKRHTGGEPPEEAINRFKPLHNFDLPWLKWGNQKLLRCMKVDSNGDVSVVDRNQSSDTGGGSGGDVIRAKRFRSSYDVDRKIESYCKFSSSEKVKVDRNQSSESCGGGCGGGGGGGYVIGAKRRNSEVEKRFRSSYDDDRNIESYCRFSSSEKPPVRIGIGSGVAGDGEIKATREKLMFDFQKEVVKMKDAILRDRLVDPPPLPPPPPSYNPTAERPWNLRTRRAACKAPRSPSYGVNTSGEVLKPNSSPASLRPANGGGDATTGGEKRERPKFSVSLSRRELEEDFMAMAGRRLPRKPKKRPRVVQKQLDTLFPGLWLSEITADLYKVPDEAETGKR